MIETLEAGAAATLLVERLPPAHGRVRFPVPHPYAVSVLIGPAPMGGGRGEAVERAGIRLPARRIRVGG